MIIKIVVHILEFLMVLLYYLSLISKALLYLI